MDFVEIVNILDENLDRNCIIFKSSDLMQKTVTYSAISTFSVNLNEEVFEDINQAFFIIDEDKVYLYLERLLGENNRNYISFAINEISILEVEA